MTFYKNNFPKLYEKEKLNLTDFIELLLYFDTNINFKNKRIFNLFKTEFNKLHKKPTRKAIEKIIRRVIPKTGTILSINYWFYRGYSKNIAKEKISKIQKKRSFFGDPDKNWDHSSFNYFLNKVNGDKELALTLFNEKNNKTKQTKENFIKRYGEIEGSTKWKAYLNNRRDIAIFGDPDKNWDHSSFNYFLNKVNGDKELALTLFNEKNNKTKQTKENFIKRYGEIEGSTKWDSYKKIQAYVGVTKEYFIEKHGEIEGLIKWINLIEKRKLYYTSKESIRFFIPIYKKLRKKGLARKDIYWGIKGSKEWFFRKNENIYFYDFTIPKLKLVLEYHGEAFHPNPKWSIKKLNEWKQPFSKEKYTYFLKKDNLKRNIVKENNFKIIEIYSSEKEKSKKLILKTIDSIM